MDFTTQHITVVAMLLLAVVSGDRQDPIYVDIHIPVVQDPTYERVLSANQFLNKMLGNNEIDFANTHTPHVTLYLTAWTCPASRGTAEYFDPGPGPRHETCVQQIEDRVSSVMYDLYVPGKFGPCSVSVGEPFAAGTYAMMNVTVDGCLQKYSDTIVNATHKLSEPNQTVPSWVESLPEPERSEKIHDIEKYGSPNVFAEFQPHVSIGWSSNATAIAEAVAEMKKHLNTSSSSFQGDVVALGSVGLHGTVLQRQDLAIFNVTNRYPCENWGSLADCKADNLTSGGCIWCDIVDRRPFCTTRMQANDLPRFPPHECR